MSVPEAAFENDVDAKEVVGETSTMAVGDWLVVVVVVSSVVGIDDSIAASRVTDAGVAVVVAVVPLVTAANVAFDWDGFVAVAVAGVVAVDAHGAGWRRMDFV